MPCTLKVMTLRKCFPKKLIILIISGSFELLTISQKVGQIYINNSLSTISWDVAISI